MKPIRQSTINIITAAFLCVALPLFTLGSYAIRASARNVSAAAQQEIRTHLLGEDINAASDFLTDQVRTFAVTHDRASLYAYWNEVESGKRRDAALAESKARNLPPGEIALLAQAKRESDILVAVETRSMRLMAEAFAYASKDMPLAVGSARLEPRDEALSAASKVNLARELVFGTSYWEHKRAIRRAVEEYRSLSHMRAQKETSAAQGTADRAFAVMALLSILTFLAGALIIVIYYRLISMPVRDYIKTLTTEDPETGFLELEPKGSYELVSLAMAVNARRAQRLRAEQAFRDSELRLRTNLYLLPLAAMETDETNKIRTWNLAAEKMFGYTAEEVIGREVVELLVPECQREKVLDFIGRLDHGSEVNKNINRNVTKDGREIVCEWRNAPLRDSRGQWIGWAALVRDITEEKAEAEKILYLSRHDPLTGLLNRRSMQEKLDEERLRCKRTGGTYATIMLDADKFKLFNDRHGHECGDVVLKGIAATMEETLRSTDSVGRWGGEEFLILLPETDRKGGLELAEKIRKQIEQKAVPYDGELFKVTVTAGIAACHGDERTDDCIRRADEALLSGKQQGRNRVVEAE